MGTSIFGTGNMAGGLASLFAGAGHQLTIASRDPAKQAGLKVVDAGALAVACYLEPVADLNIGLGFGLGNSTDIAPA